MSAPAPAPDDGQQQPAPADAPPDPPAQAVTDWEAEAKKWEKRSKENWAKLKEAEPKLADYARMVQESKTDAQRKDEELARWQTEAEKWRTASVSSRIHAMAALSFADPTDAVAALADSGKYLDAGGQVNDKAIEADLNDLLERKPHWRRATDTTAPPPAGPRLPAPNPAQGSGHNGNSAPNPAAEFAAILQGQLKP